MRYTKEDAERILARYLALQEAMTSAGVSAGRGGNVGAYTVPFPAMLRRTSPSRVIFPAEQQWRKRKKKVTESLQGTGSGRNYSASEIGTSPANRNSNSRDENRPRPALMPGFRAAVARLRKNRK